MNQTRSYQANFTKGSLLVPESRIVARLLLDKVSAEDWQQNIVANNVLQKRTVNTAYTQANLVRHRLETMQSELWSQVADGSMETATHAVLAATVKFSPLFGDFLALVLSEQYRKFAAVLNPNLWDEYMENSRGTGSGQKRFAQSTEAKLKQNAIRMLAEAGYITDTKSLTLQALDIAPPVVAYLKKHGEVQVLKSLQVSP